MAKYTVSISITYDLSGELLEEYKEWLEDCEDDEELREAFLTDRFAPEDWSETIDPNAKLTFTPEDGGECRCAGCMETIIYGKGMCQECFDQGCDETDYDGSNH